MGTTHTEGKKVPSVYPPYEQGPHSCAASGCKPRVKQGPPQTESKRWR